MKSSFELTRCHAPPKLPEGRTEIECQYDRAAKRYDRLYTHGFDRAEEAIISDMLELNGFFEPGARVLDVGCGTGMFLDLARRQGRTVAARDYVGLDISRQMLLQAVKKWPDHVFLQADAERHMWVPSSGKFTHVVSLFGSFSYLHPEKMAVLMPENVALFLMVYGLGNQGLQSSKLRDEIGPGFFRPPKYRYTLANAESLFPGPPVTVRGLGSSSTDRFRRVPWFPASLARLFLLWDMRRDGDHHVWQIILRGAKWPARR